MCARILGESYKWLSIAHILYIGILWIIASRHFLFVIRQKKRGDELYCIIKRDPQVPSVILFFRQKIL